MKVIVAATCTACILGVFATPAMARKYKPYKQHRHYEASAAYPYATARQRRNSVAYETGGYYETIPSEHAFGSRSWWLMMQQRSGGRR